MGEAARRKGENDRENIIDGDSATETRVPSGDRILRIIESSKKRLGEAGLAVLAERQRLIDEIVAKDFAEEEAQQRMERIRAIIDRIVAREKKDPIVTHSFSRRGGDGERRIDSSRNVEFRPFTLRIDMNK